jgi:hypothetical protein
VDIEEPIHLHLQASTGVNVRPVGVVAELSLLVHR